MDVGKQGAGKQDVIVIKDPLSILAFVVLAGILFVGAYQAVTHSSVPAAIICIVGGIVCLFIVKNLNKGTIIDIPNDLLSYPGGRVADGILDYINPVWLAQKLNLRQGKMALSDISGIETRDESYVNDKGKVCRRYFIEFTGAFGAVSINFSSRSKRNQLYNVLCQVLEMGDPVVLR